MNIIESIKIAVNAIFANKLRSLLTMLGIIIGISSVITVVAIGEGSQKMIDKEFEMFGAGKAYLGMNWNQDFEYGDELTREDLEVLQDTFGKEIKSMIPSVGNRGKVNKGSKEIEIRLSAGNEMYLSNEKIEILHGRNITAEDLKAKRVIGLIDEELAMELLGRRNVVGEDIDVLLNNRLVTIGIIGVFEKPKSSLENMGGQSMYSVVMPWTSLDMLSGSEGKFTGVELVFEADSTINKDEISNKMLSVVERRHNSQGKDKYQVQTAEEQLEMINKVTGIITAVIGAIAAISLLVGGIGVMNIMFVSVTERTREIGIRKAIGARKKDILGQFLVESVIVSGIGGIIGTILGLGFAFILGIFIKIEPSVSIKTIAIAWMFSAGVGIFFGIYPANKAAKLDPIDALRYE